MTVSGGGMNWRVAFRAAPDLYLWGWRNHSVADWLPFPVGELD